jgi:hypothetical protein
MVKFIFKLKQKYIPDLTQKKEEDNTYGGIRLIYIVYKIYYVSLFGREISLFRLILGEKTFLRPYKKFWDKRMYRLPYVYWGKKTHPLTRLWVVIPNNYPLGIHKIIPEVNLIHQHVKLFGYTFVSKEITAKLFGYKDKFQLKSIQ